MLMIENPGGIKNLPKMLEEGPAIGVILTGDGGLSQELGVPRQYDHQEVKAGVRENLDVCKAHNFSDGWFHTTMDNVEQIVAERCRLLMSDSTHKYTLLHKGWAAVGRN